MLLEISDLTVEVGTARPVLREVSLRVAAGEVVGLVGESGSGKSTTAKAALGMFPAGARVRGGVRFAGTDVLALDGAALRRHRARRVAMVHQDPRAALNPMRRIGDFLVERQPDLSKKDARRRGVELLGRVGLREPERRMRQYPHELSGGMLQRVVLAAALAREPELLLADESTSALDVTTQAETLALLRSVQAERGLGVLFVTHDLHLAAAYCDRVCVLYAGQVVEDRPAASLFTGARHPYTTGLLDCAPALGEHRPIVPIPGQPPSLDDLLPGCPFAPRCGQAEAECADWTVRMLPAGDGEAACRRIDDLVREPA
ncbi:ABC transporter ATP-binding protein [Amycolatopsis suaedae]|uniref:ABC transporter ATP-binding protein n=1 Tax=Amycolatopsis suaedae TaxID=2510978 RepID=A0A4Q7J1T5_9PSEU|nr:ABC transporter ATP-binding protein [Amycolatopsis suaedae]RZQ60829.1 ABC transporter ATP-binding protein [Amycolatopsis suaedae]